MDRAGSISFQTGAIDGGSYRVQVRARQGFPGSDFNRFNLSLAIDGIPCGTAVCDPNGIANFWLPVIQSGTHTITLTWNNMGTNRIMIVDELRIDSVGGPDENENGIPDWLDERLTRAGSVTVPTYSYTSPVCIEGITDATADNISFTGFHGADTPFARMTLGRSWYANIPLDPNATTDISTHFHNTERTETAPCQWLTTYIHDYVETDSYMFIRTGDALLLNTKADTSPNAYGYITFGNDSYYVASDSDLTVRFVYPGTYVIHAEHYTDSVVHSNRTIYIRVYEGKFSGNPAVLTGMAREWQNPNLEPALYVTAHPSLSIQGSAVNGSGSNYRLHAKLEGEYPVVARLYEGGPITDVAKAAAIGIIWETEETGVPIYEFPDGTVLCEGRLKLSSIPEGFALALGTWTPGIYLEDGSREMIFTADDVDENGVLTYRILRTLDATTGNCHYIRAYDNDELIYTYR